MADLTADETQAIFDEVLSVPSASGYFHRVNGGEPTNAPGRDGITCAVWLQEIRPVPSRSGLNVTSARLVFNVRLYSSMVSDPQDAIDPTLTIASVMLMGLFSGGFDFDNSEAYVDLLGAHGEPLGGRAGYLEQDGRMLRVITINLPVIRDDSWSQQR